MAAAVCTLFLLFAYEAAAQTGLPCPCNRPGYAMALDDEFDRLRLQRNGAEGGEGVWGTTVDGYNAYHVENRTIRSSHERELYSDGDAAETLHLPPANDPFRIAGGVLSITAAPLPAAVRNKIDLDYSSGLLVTRNSFNFQYGYMEVKARIPSGRGLWPAIWLFRRDGTYGEIDLMEALGHETSRLYCTVHYQTDVAGLRDVHQDTVVDRTGPDLADGFHLYAVDWTAQEVVFYLDGMEIGRTKTAPALRAPMYILLNLAVGGQGSWPGAVDAMTRFPASFQVDYVRVWRDRDALPAVR